MRKEHHINLPNERKEVEFECLGQTGKSAGIDHQSKDQEETK